MKKIIALLLVLVMVLSLAACGKKADEKVTINVIAAQYGVQTADWWVGFEKDYEAAYENVDLVVDVVSWNDIYTVVNTRIANGEAPDILNIDVFADYQADELLLPAKDYVSDATYAKFYQSFLDQSVVDGTVWAVPDLASARALYYNADILEAAGVKVPTTWEELEAACEAIKAYDAEIYPWGIDMTTDEGQAAFAYYTWNNGGGFVDAEGNWTLNSAENVEAIEFAIGLVNNGLTNNDPANQTRYDLQDLFGAGKLAMVIGPNSIPTYIADKGLSVNYGVAAIPCTTGTSVSAGVMDRFMCFKQEGRSDAEMAAITKVIDAFYDDEPYAEWVLMEGFIPATASGGDICIAKDPALESWVGLAAGAQFYPSIAGWDEVKFGVIDAQQQMLTGADPKTVLDALQAELVG